MAPPPVFRRLRPDDAEACATLHAQAFTPHWPAHDFLGQIVSADRIASAATLGSHSVAALAMTRFVGDEADLLTFVVDRRLRRHGLGTGLLAWHLSALTAAAVQRVFLEVEKDNKPACHLYRKFGFTIVGERGGYYGGARKTRTDALVMRCDL